jgi:hypothetical protein
MRLQNGGGQVVNAHALLHMFIEERELARERYSVITAANYFRR